VAYKLALPQSSAVHLVFHISLLKKVVGANVPISPLLPDTLSTFQVPEKVLERWVVSRGSRLVV
jgi:hypothetical protein